MSFEVVIEAEGQFKRLALSHFLPWQKKETSMSYRSREAGHGIVEYALILTLMVIVVIVALSLLGPAIGNIFSRLQSF